MNGFFVLFIFPLLTLIHRDTDDAWIKEAWKARNCSRGQHFVGKSLYENDVYCDACGLHATNVKRKNNQVISYKF